MTKKFFEYYQFLMPLCVLPLVYCFWLSLLKQNHGLVVLVLSVPIVFSYIVPAIGTNVLRLWEFNTSVRLGRFRPHHGFVFGTAAGFLSFLCSSALLHGYGLSGCLSSGFILGSVFAFWNWYYDLFAVRSRFIKIYRPEHYKDKSDEEVIAEYAPIIFGGFGLYYGCFLNLVYNYFIINEKNSYYWTWSILGNLGGVLFPVAVFVVFTVFKYGQNGLRSFIKGGQG